MTKKNNVFEKNMNKSVELTQTGAKALLKGAVGTIEVTESYIQGVYNAGYQANVDALGVAKGYWDAMTELRKDWLVLASETGEQLIDAAGTFEVPYQKEAMDLGKNAFDFMFKAVDGFMPKAKAAK
ncbi:MAG: hypothetical protein R2684_03345 [Pyrinomonadaceae bacterium]